MSVYEAVREYKRGRALDIKKLDTHLVLQHICCFGLSLLFSFSGFSEKFSPFAIAFTACVSKAFTVTAALGAAIGYFVALDAVNALRYTSTVLAAVVILISLKSFKNLCGRTTTPVAVVFVCLFTTGFAVCLSQGASLMGLCVALCEAFLGGAVTYVFYKSKVYLLIKDGVSSLTSKEITSLVISGSLLLLSLKFVNVYGVSLSNIIAVFAILLCSYYGKESGGAIVGICCGIVSSFATGNLFYIAYFALGGLLSGVLAGLGKLCCVIAFVLSGLLCVVISSSWSNLFPVVAETAIPTVLFLIVSHKFNYSFKSFFTPSVSSPVVNSVKCNITDKLHKVSEFSTEICNTLENVNDALQKSEKSNLSLIPTKVKNNICSTCGLYSNCWSDSKDKTKTYFDLLLNLKKQDVYLNYKTMPVDFSSFCIRNDSIASEFNKHFTECKINEKTENRIKEIHSLASQQFVNVAGLLESLCDEIDEDVKYDMDIAMRCKAVSSTLGFSSIDCCCVIDSLERTRLELRVNKKDDKADYHNLTKQLSVVSGKALDYPSIDEYEDYLKLIFREKPFYNVISAGEQFNANDEKYSGDTFTTFTDEKGYFYAVICDGMGTGTKAAVSSGLTVALLEKLINAGFSVESSIKTVNTSLISRSGDECSVTLDLVAIDLYTGNVEFYKCGSQHTLLKKKGKTSQVNYETLPLGILSDVEIGYGNVTLGNGDILILCSDGVRDEDFWQLRNAVKVFDNGNVKKFTQEIAQAIRNSQPEKRDDFTMLTLVITKNK